MESHSLFALSLLLFLSPTLLLPTTTTATTTTNTESHIFAQLLPTTTLARSTQKLTKLHFFFHDIPNGPHPTAVIIARPAKQTTIGFGTLVMIDDPITLGPEPGSRLVGRAQGMYAESSLSGSGNLLMCFTFMFTHGKYNRSSISVLGRYPALEPEREMPIVGGSGVFRFATGYALAKKYKYDIKTGLAVSEYNVFVLHYDNYSVVE